MVKTTHNKRLSFFHSFLLRMLGVFLTLCSSFAFALPAGYDNAEDAGLHTIWVVGDVKIVEYALNACANFFGSGGMLGMLKIAAILALIMMLIGVINQKKGSIVNYMLMFVFMVVAFNIKTDLYVASYFDGNSGNAIGTAKHGQKISDVPIGVAYPLMIFSHMSKKFTGMYDQEMQTLPELGTGLGDNAITSKSGGMMIHGTEGFFSPLKTIISLRWRFNSPRNQLILKNLQANAETCEWHTEYGKYADKTGTLAAISNPEQPVGIAKLYFEDQTAYQTSCTTAGRVIVLMMIQNVLNEQTNGDFAVSPVAKDIAKRRVASSKVGSKQVGTSDFVQATQKEIDALPNAIASAAGGQPINRSNATQSARISAEIERIKQELVKNESSKQPKINIHLVNDSLFSEMTGFTATQWKQESEAINQVSASTLQAEILFGNVVEKCATSQGGTACYQAVSLMTEAKTHAAIDSAGEAGMFQHFGPLAMNVLLFIYVVMTPIIAVVIMAKGIYGWKLVGSYLLFAVWVNSWLPLTMAISYYMQQTFTDKLAEVLSLVQVSGMKGAVYSPTLINAVLDGAQDTIATASVFMATVPMLMFAILSGSAYGFVHLAQRAAMTGKDFVDESRVAPKALEDANLGVNEAVRAISLGGPRSGVSAEEVSPYFVSNMGRNDPFKIHFDSGVGVSGKYAHLLEDNQARSEILETGNTFSADESTSRAVSDGVSFSLNEYGSVTAKAVRSGENAHSVSNDGSMSIYAGADGNMKVSATAANKMYAKEEVGGSVGFNTPFGGAKASAAAGAEQSFTTQGTIEGGLSAGIKGQESWNTSSNIRVVDSNGVERNMSSGEKFQDDLTYKINGQYVEGSKFTEAIEQSRQETQSERHAIMNEFSHSQNSSISFDLDKQQFNNIRSGEFVMAKENAADAIMSMTDRNPQLTSVANDIMRAKTTEEIASIAQNLAQSDMQVAAKMVEGYFTGQNDNIANQAKAVADAIETGERQIADKAIEKNQAPIDASQIDGKYKKELQTADDIKNKFENSELHRTTVDKIKSGEERLNQAQDAFMQKTNHTIAERDAKNNTTAASLMAKDIATDNSDNAKAIQENIAKGDYKAVAKSAVDLASVGGTSSVFREPSQSGLDPVTELLATLTGSSKANAATTPFYNAPETNATREDNTNNQGQAEHNHRHSEPNENTHNQAEKDRSGSVNGEKQAEELQINEKLTPQTDAWQYRQQGQYQDTQAEQHAAEQGKNEHSGSLKDTQAVQSQTESVGDKYPLFDKLMGRGEGGYDSYNKDEGKKNSKGETIHTPHHGDEIENGKKLSDFTIAELMDKQAKGELFALGHYQITPPAMKDALRLSGVSTDEKFTPEIQDKLFEDGLLKKAGVTKGHSYGPLYGYITGEHDDIDKAVRAASQEWSSVPVPKDEHVNDRFGERDLKAGDSYYKGVGSNRSHISVEDAKAAIEEMRANYLAAHSVDNQADNQSQETVIPAETAPHLESHSSGSLKDDNQGQSEKAEQADKERLIEQARAEEDERQKQADEEERRLAQHKVEERKVEEEQQKKEQGKQAEKQHRLEARHIREERLKQNTDGKTPLSKEDFDYNINLSSERNAMKSKLESRLAELNKGGIQADEKEETAQIKSILKDIKQHEKASEAQVSLWTKVGASLPEIPQWLVDGSAGFGDGVSFGFSKWARKQLDIDNVNTNSQVYLASEFGGEMYQLVAGGVATLGSKGLMLTGKVQKVAHWTPSHVSTNTLRAGDWVMTGSSKGLVGHINHYLSGVGVPKKLVSKFLPEKYANKIITREYPFKSGFETVVPKKDLSWPPGREKIKGLIGQRIYSPKK